MTALRACTYTGSAQTPCSATVTGAGGLSLSPTPSYSNNTNAGTATASYTFAGDTNHTGSSDSKNFTITAKDVTASITAADKVYDGNDQRRLHVRAEREHRARRRHLRRHPSGPLRQQERRHPRPHRQRARTRRRRRGQLQPDQHERQRPGRDHRQGRDRRDHRRRQGVRRQHRRRATRARSNGDHRPDVVTCDGTHPALFGNKNVGTGKTVTASGLALAGADAGNYNLTNTSASDQADITAKDVTASITAADKVYDGNTDAAYTCAPNGDHRAPTSSPATAPTRPIFGNKNVGTGKTVTASGLALAGADAGNYNLTNTSANDLADITAKDVTAAITAADKVYDGNDRRRLHVLAERDHRPDVVTCDGTHPAHFGNKNVGTGKTVTASGLALAGADAGNYNLTNTSASDLAEITAKDVTASITAADKVYDGNTDAAYTCALERRSSRPTSSPATAPIRPTSATRTSARARPSPPAGSRSPAPTRATTT